MKRPAKVNRCPGTLAHFFFSLTHGDVVAAGDADCDAENHLADLHRRDLVRFAEADPHAGQAVEQVHQG